MILVTSLILHCVLTNDGTGDTLRSEFVRALASVQPGDSKAQVLRHVGRPDRILKGARFPIQVEDVWAYGVVRAGDGRDYATLGCIGFNGSGEVSAVYGSTNTPPDVTMSEDELRILLGHVDAIGHIDGYSFNPLFVIRAVNVLCKHNREDVIAVVNEYQRVWSPMSRTDEWGIALLLHTLVKAPFPAKDLPPLGVPSPRLPQSKRRLFPRYPILIVDDVPLLLIQGFSFFGSPRKIVPAHIDWFRRVGQMRRQPLRPNDNPLNIAVSLRKSAAWTSYMQLEDSDSEMVLRQFLRAMRGVPKANAILQRCVLPSAERWDVIAAEFDLQGIRWNARKGRYVVPRSKIDDKGRRAAIRMHKDVPGAREKGRMSEGSLLIRENQNGGRMPGDRHHVDSVK